MGPFSPQRQAGRQDVAAELGAPPTGPPQSHQGDVVVAAVGPVRPVNDDLLNPDFFFKLLGHQRVVIPNPDGIAPRAVPVPATHTAGQRPVPRAGSWSSSERRLLGRP